jgi:hypothetical protein
MRIIDNFLDQLEYKTLSKDILSNEFAWFYRNHKVTKETNEIDNFQFIHAFWLQGVASNKFEIIIPLIKKLGKPSLMRAKANLGTVTKEHYTSELHTDNDNNPVNFTGIYYVNDNNGYTIFEDGTRVDSKANRFLEFSSDMIHAGVSQTDKKRRVVINLNYIK